MFLLDLFQGLGGKVWEADEIGYTFLGDCCLEVQMRKNGGDHKKEKFFINHSVEVVISLKQEHQDLLKPLLALSTQ